MNLSHRSAIKRIQEQDSSPSLPMILCVCAILPGEQQEAEDGKTIQGNPILELTDGWYRIRSNTDPTLTRAIQAKKLKVGYKIAIAGAKVSTRGSESLPI